MSRKCKFILNSSPVFLTFWGVIFLTSFWRTDYLSAQKAKPNQYLQFSSLNIALEIAESKISQTIDELSFNPRLHPGHTNRATGKWDTTHLNRNEWTSGFFSGSLWYLYRLSGDKKWAQYAMKWTNDLEPVAKLNFDHDLGFRIFNSFGNGYNLIENRHYYKTILIAANTLSNRFDPNIGAIKSWDWIGNYPVIIDNLINLELLFWSAQATNNQQWYEMAISHAEVSLRHHIKTDGSTYHVVDFNHDGSVIDKFTTQGCNRRAQGCGDVSVWARGQAWAIYGFTMIYRYTGEERFLKAAVDATDYFIGHLPSDFVPYYDFMEPVPSVRTKDSSASAIAASGLFELYRYTNDIHYFNTAVQILESLSSEPYLSMNSSTSSILKQSTLHRGYGNVGTSYADYYYLEAIVRYLELTGHIFQEIETLSTLYLDQNYPNPFNNATTIFYSLADESLVDLSVYDISGRKISTIIHENLPSGTYKTTFHADGISSGIYFYVLRANGERITKKMTLLK